MELRRELTTNDTPVNKSVCSFPFFWNVKKRIAKKIKKIIRHAQYRVLKNNRQRF